MHNGVSSLVPRFVIISEDERVERIEFIKSQRLNEHLPLQHRSPCKSLCFLVKRINCFISAHLRERISICAIYLESAREKCERLER